MSRRTEDRATITSDTTVETAGGVEMSPIFPPTIATDRGELLGVDLRGGNACWVLRLVNIDAWVVGGVLTTSLPRAFYQTLLDEG